MADRNQLVGFDRLHGTEGTFSVAVCDMCLSGTTLPYLSETELGPLYPTEYNAYAQPSNRILRLASTVLYRSRYRRSLRQHPLSNIVGKQARVLDVGGGRGDLAIMLEGSGAQVTNVEPSPDACREAERRGITSHCGTISSFAATRPTLFDAVIFQHSLEHVPDPVLALQVAFDLLVNDGSLLVTLPNFGSAQSEAFKSHWFHLDLPRHRTHFTTRGLIAVLENSGFGDIVVSTSTSPDGLTMSKHYLRNGSAPSRLRTRLALATKGILFSPLTARSRYRGDILHASARKSK